MIVNFD